MPDLTDVLNIAAISASIGQLQTNRLESKAQGDESGYIFSIMNMSVGMSLSNIVLKLFLTSASPSQAGFLINGEDPALPNFVTVALEDVTLSPFDTHDVTVQLTISANQPVGQYWIGIGATFDAESIIPAIPNPTISGGLMAVNVTPD